MTNSQNAQFAGFSGQLVKSGIDTNMPLVALEQGVDATVWGNLDKIQSMMPKLKDVFVRETRVFRSPLEEFITKFDERFGAGLEQVAVKYGAYNEKQDGTCVPLGIPEMVSQLDVVNWAYSVDIDIPDYFIDKAVLDEGQRGSVVAALMEAPIKTIHSARYRAWVQLLSDVVDGERSISSKDSYNGYAAKGSAASVTYAPEIVGYAGMVEKSPSVLPEIQLGVQYSINSPIEALNICNRLKSIAADMRFESTAFNKLGIMTFVTSEPLLIMETKVLDAMDAVFAEYNARGNANGNYGYAGFPTVSAREYLRSFSQIVEIDSFAALPDNTDASYEFKTAGYCLKAVLTDRDAFVEIIKNQSVEGQRCAKKRLTGYNWQGQSIFSIWRGVNSYALLGKTEGGITVTGGSASVGGDTVTSAAPGTVVTVAPTSGTITKVVVNGEDLGAVDSFVMPQADAVVVITASE